ncbi:DRG family regulatory protein, Tma46 [Nitzschia inconspicua]|uniref:DRG family regulatory protein, Tma46 n=1 Tax=Nitzschia inconspicua TaxID=303405 RepID=A0A9K3PZ12_9STRA|nr:DRG family regulatory protein, Tma46 [Nitzschia inconspicua]
MPPKKTQGASKKADQKKKNQAIEDRTFGLKNKNKSKKVQQYVQAVKTSVLNGGDRKQRMLEEQRKRQKAEAKARKKAMEEEANALFNEALGALNKKSTNLKEGKTEAKGRDADDDNTKKSTSRAMKMMYQMDAKEMEERLREDPNYVPTLEDQIEAERQQKVEELKKSGKGTPVTPETFAAWQEGKRKRRAAEAKKLVESELKKKKGGKGLAVLTGRALYEYKQELFNIAEDDSTPAGATAAKDDGDTKMEDGNQNGNGNDTISNDVEKVAEKVQTDLFLEGDDDLDDLDDD